MKTYSKQLAAELADVFQDFVDMKDIAVPNLEKEEINNDDGVHLTTIYGSDWDFLIDGLIGVLVRNEVCNVSDDYS